MKHLGLMSLAALAALGIAGCGISLIESGPPPRLYDLSPAVDPAVKAGAPVSFQLLIEEPRASKALDTDRMLVRPSGQELQYFGGTRWADRAPRLVQDALVRGFEESERIVGVGRQTVGLRADYVLIADLHAFETVFAGPAPEARIEMTLKLVRQPLAQIVSTRSFKIERPAGNGSLEASAGALEAALGALVAEAVPWALEVGALDHAARRAAARDPEVPMRAAPAPLPSKSEEKKRAPAVGP